MFNGLLFLNCIETAVRGHQGYLFPKALKFEVHPLKCAGRPKAMDNDLPGAQGVPATAP